MLTSHIVVSDSNQVEIVTQDAKAESFTANLSQNSGRRKRLAVLQKRNSLVLPFPMNCKKQNKKKQNVPDSFSFVALVVGRHRLF